MEQTVRHGANGVPQVLLPLMEGPQRIPQILDQGAAQGHIQHLEPPADPEDGPPRRQIGPDQGQLRPVALRVRRPGATVLCAVPRWGQIASAAQQQSAAGQVRLGAEARHRKAARPTDCRLIPLHPSPRPGNLDAYSLHSASFSWRGGEYQPAAPSCSPRMRTRAAISSTAPSMPVTLESRVRSYRRISPQLCPV